MASSAKKRKKSLPLSGHQIFLHPAALGKGRKCILTRRAKELGGDIVENEELFDFDNFVCVVLFVESIVTEGEGCSVVTKMKTKDSRLKLLSITWLSDCIKRGEALDTTPYSCIQATEPKMEAAETSAQTLAFEQKFVCSKASRLTDSSCVHDRVISELEHLASAYTNMNDKWRAFGYQKAIAAIKRNQEKINDVDQLSKIPGIGPKMAAKIAEILEHGALRKTKEICDTEKAQVISLFNDIWGVGPNTAESLFNQGFRTLNDLKRSESSLTRQQRIGLDLFDDLTQKMPREEATLITEHIKDRAAKMSQVTEVIACGSYRRGKTACGDIDILIPVTNSESVSDVFNSLLQGLKSEGFLTHDLSRQHDGNQRKYLGVCKPLQVHRRIDIIVVPVEEKAAAMLYFTGSAHFNRSMRLLAKKKGMKLCEHWLKKGDAILATPTERSIFEALNISYLNPSERNH